MHADVLKTIEELETFMAGVDDAMALPREAAEFVHAIVLATRATRGLEIGTSYGYSGLWIASALANNGGTLITIDREQRKSAAARRNFASAGLSSCIDIRTGSAAEIIPTIDGPFDFVLSDADKANCIRYIELLTDKLADRAVILTDNSITHRPELEAFITWIRRHPDYTSVPVPLGNGMELSIKRHR